VDPDIVEEDRRKNKTGSVRCPFISFGGAEGDRTPGLMTASHALSQLSYSPGT
jgi:hypothetical protein